MNSMKYIFFDRIKNFSTIKFMSLNVFFVLFFSSCSKESGVDCFGGGSQRDKIFEYSVGVLSDSSKILLPKNFDESYTFTNNLGMVNSLAKGIFISGTKVVNYSNVTKKTVCYSYNEIYNKSIPYYKLVYTPQFSPNFYHEYKSTIFNKNYNFLNVSENLLFDSTYEIVAIELNNSFNNYSFVIPTGKIVDKLTNFSHRDSITIINKKFYDIFEIYADSVNYNINKIIPFGIYYNLNKGLVGYYLSNGETWVKQ